MTERTLSSPLSSGLLSRELTGCNAVLDQEGPLSTLSTRLVLGLAGPKYIDDILTLKFRISRFQMALSECLRLANV